MKTTIELAREAGLDAWWDSGSDWRETFNEHLKAFEALVRADQDEKYKWDIHSCGPSCTKAACVAMREAVEAEREACAKVCDELVPDMSRTANDASVWDVATFDCAIAIRARGSI
jgi:cytochrome c556